MKAFIITAYCSEDCVKYRKEENNLNYKGEI